MSYMIFVYNFDKEMFIIVVYIEVNECAVFSFPMDKYFTSNSRVMQF